MTKFNDLQPGDLFHFPNCATSVYRKEHHDCPCCGGPAVASLYFTSDEDQPLIARIDADMEIVHVTDMAHWTVPFASVGVGGLFRKPDEPWVWIRLATASPNARSQSWPTADDGTSTAYTIAPDTPVLRVKS